MLISNSPSRSPKLFQPHFLPQQGFSSPARRSQQTGNHAAPARPPFLPDDCFSCVSVPEEFQEAVRNYEQQRYATRPITGRIASMIYAVLLLGAVWLACPTEASAQARRYARPTDRQAVRRPMRRSVVLPPARVRHLSHGQNYLPRTTLDSFVVNAGADAHNIYGDEGYYLPPFDEYTKDHRIQRGIHGARSSGLTTGHGSLLPDATGGDEFVDGPEYTYSAPRYSTITPAYRQRRPSLHHRTFGFESTGRRAYKL